MDAAGSENAVVMGWSEGGSFAAMFAATYPERTRALIAYAAPAKVSATADFPMGLTEEAEAGFLTYVREGWGTGLGSHFAVPSRANDEAFRRWFGRFERMAISPSEGVALARLNFELDVRHILPTIRVPTLVLHQRHEVFIPIDISRDLAERIPGARLVELSGTDHLFWFGDPDETVSEILEFVTGVRPEPEVDRVLATVMFADIVGSTARAAELGDRRWHKTLESYYSLAGQEIERFRGKQVKTLGDGILATFDGPARAVRCAQALTSQTKIIGLDVRSGLHTGEIELMGDDVGGIAVHIGSRVAGHAAAGEVVCTSTVKDLVVGSGIDFAERGSHELKGIPGEWRLFSVSS
jgi:class 3 adenylate cyclase